MWSLKALLEYYIKTDADLLLGGEVSLIYNTEKNFLTNETIPLFEWIYNVSKIEIKEVNDNNKDVFFENVIEKLYSNSPVYCYAVGYELPYHYEYKGVISEANNAKEIEKLEDIRNKKNQSNVGGHNLIISGYDKKLDLFHISDLYHSELRPFYGWVAKADLLNAISSDFLGNKKFTRLELTSNVFNNSQFCDIDNILLRNRDHMLNLESAQSFHFGISALKKLAEEMNNWDSIDSEILFKKQDYLYNAFLDVIMQRDRHISFLNIIQNRTNMDTETLRSTFEKNYHIYCRIRNMLFKNSRKKNYNYTSTIQLYLNEVAENETNAFYKLL